MPPCSRRQIRLPRLTPNGGAVIVSVHSTALPPWSSVPQGERVPAWPTVPRLPAKALAYFSAGKPNGLTVSQSEIVWLEGHQVGAGVSGVWKIDSGCSEPLVTSPVRGSRVAWLGRPTPFWPNAPG